MSPDPHIKVCGKRESVKEAKERIMSVLDTKVSGGHMDRYTQAHTQPEPVRHQTDWDGCKHSVPVFTTVGLYTCSLPDPTTFGG